MKWKETFFFSCFQQPGVKGLEAPQLLGRAGDGGRKDEEGKRGWRRMGGMKTGVLGRGLGVPRATRAGRTRHSCCPTSGPQPEGAAPGRPGEPGDTAVTRPPAAGPRRAGRCCRRNNRKLQEGKTRLMPSAGCFPPPSRPVPRVPAATAACPWPWDHAHAPPAPAPRQAALVFFIVEVQL